MLGNLIKHAFLPTVFFSFFFFLNACVNVSNIPKYLTLTFELHYVPGAISVSQKHLFYFNFPP